VTAARASIAGGATWLGVTSIVEALELRSAGIDTSILNVGWTRPDEVGDAAHSHRVNGTGVPPRIRGSRESLDGSAARYGWDVATTQRPPAPKKGNGATPRAVLQSPESVNELRAVFGYPNLE